MTGATDAATRITVLKHFVAGRDKAFIAAATGMSEDAVMSVATKHGYPKPESMERAIGILEKELNGDLPAATMSGPGPTRRIPAPLPVTVSTTFTPTGVPRVHDETKTLIAAAKGHPSKIVQRQADRVIDAIDRLRALIREDEEKHAEKRKAAEEKAAAKAEVERLKKQLEAAKAKLRPAKPVPNGNGDAARIRDWAREQNIAVPRTGRVPREVREAYETAHAS
jgi:hypothetical protein